LEKNVTAGEINIMAATPGVLLKAGFDINMSEETKAANASIKESQYSKTVHYSTLIRNGFAFAKDGIKLKDEVIKSYEQLVKMYFEHKDMEVLSKRCNEFTAYYGYEMDVGTYLFGSTYCLTNELVFKKAQKK